MGKDWYDEPVEQAKVSALKIVLSGLLRKLKRVFGR